MMLGILFGVPGWGELLVVGVIGLLIFGKRLPEVGKSLGKGIVEFKKGLSGINDQLKKTPPPESPESGGHPDPPDPPLEKTSQSSPSPDINNKETSATPPPHQD